MIDPSEQNFALLSSRPDFIDLFKCVSHSDEMMLGKSVGSQDIQPMLNTFISSILPLPFAVERYVPGQLKFSVDSPSDGYLFLTDRWARSWRASVNEQQVTKFGGGFIFTSLKIAKGKNSVELVYDPVYIKCLLMVSYAVSVTIGILAVVSSRRKAHP
jgi:hypothetical protein